MSVFVGIDIGSTTVTAVAIDIATGRSLGSEAVSNSAEITLPAEKARGRSEWDFSRIEETAFDAVRRLVGRVGAGSVDGIGVTGQQQGCQLFDSSSLDTVGPLISWQDRRTTEPISGDNSYLDRIAELGASHLVSEGPKGFAASGCPLVPGYTSAIIYWLHSNGMLAPNLKASTVPEFFVSRLTGQPPVTDATDAAGWGVFDVVNSRWNRELIDDLGLPPQVLPEIAQSCTKAGGLTKNAAERTGLSEGIPVSVASGDHQCSFAGAIGDIESSIGINVGTGGQCSVFVPETSALRQRDGWPDYGSLELRPFIESGYLLAGVGVVGGRSFRTVRDFFAGVGDSLFGGAGDSDRVYSRLVELAAKSAPGADGIEFEPFFTGTRREPGRRGEVSGLTPGNFTTGNVARALFEGMARQLHGSYVEAMELGSGAKSYLVGSGNGIRKNPVLRESLEALFGLPMRLSSHVDEAAVGAALCASVAAGASESISAASRAFVRYED